jgi:hypothetical protein
MNWPSPLTNISALYSWLNRLLNAAKASQIQSGVGYKVKRDTFGTTLVIDQLTKDGLPPFHIYQQSSSWLDFKVSTGYIITTGDPIEPTNTETTLTLSGGVLRYWIYLEMTATEAEVKKSATTLEWSADKIPIGWVDTSTGSGTETAIVYQVLKGHVFDPCAGQA